MDKEVKNLDRCDYCQGKSMCVLLRLVGITFTTATGKVLFECKMCTRKFAFFFPLPTKKFFR